MRIVIVGAGFAGISTAHHLARRGERDVVVVEKELGPGCHASGRNAGLLRQSSQDEALAPLLHAGSRVARRIAAASPGAIRGTGSLILGSDVGSLRAGSFARPVDAGDVVEGLAGPGLFDPEDAIVDPHSLLSAYEQAARRRGVEFRYREELTGIETRNGRVVAVETQNGPIPTPALILAAGAWAGKVAALAGSDSIKIQPKRRHIFHATLAPRDATRWPFVWNEELGAYFLPEGEELLASGCDAEPHPAGESVFCEQARDHLARKLGQVFPDMGDWRLGPGWACLRTFTGDERFLIGHDPQVSGLFWVGALGGHGMTASWAIGRLAADVFLRRRTAPAFDPARFS